MALKIGLRPGEKIIIGSAVITNGPSHAELVLENKVPVLRQKDILTPEKAQTACQRLYLAVQLMYIDAVNVRQYHQVYWELARQIIEAAPSTLRHIEAVSDFILRDEYYQALKAAQRLIRHEGDLLRDAQK